MNAKPRILLIDDSPMIHRVIGARLAADGMEIHFASNGSEGIAAAQTIGPDLILLDIEMPAPNGFEVCRRLKDMLAVSNIPIIFLSGISTTEEKVHGLNLGAIDYVTKPCDAAELLARVRAGLRNKELLDLLAQKASIDGLTGLYNRGYLNQRLSEEITFARRHERSLSCLMLDVDHFKRINDTYGHGFGDTVLKQVANILVSSCRTEDVICRYGGEEFLILARESDPAVAAERIRAQIESATFNQGVISTSVTCSIGVSDLIDGDDRIVDRADTALYKSKQTGRNRVTLFNQCSTVAPAL
jgi:two-component system, cell cycle response regulator